ncbi:unnamed protein product [Adineta ricciae]|uniref:Apple domain-containing protein n=1 Tax=Adineta ricciae TaxID=249248 RepID=A0A815NJN6_ADIRI|nr:unnamed protein product [Adineta ricciae]
MRSLCALLVFALMVVASNGAHHHPRRDIADNDDDDDAADTRDLLRSLLRQASLRKIGFDSDDEDNYSNRFYSNKRANNAAKKCTSAVPGTYYTSSSTKSIDNVVSQDDCMNRCEVDDNCYGWAYQASSKTCSVQNSIGWKTLDASYVGGSCIGLAAKEKVCKEKLKNTLYNGDWSTGFWVNTAEDCMKKCDITPSCLGYVFSEAQKYCWTQTAQYGSGYVADWTSGSCVKPKPDYPPISIENYRQQALEQHNVYRRMHCVGPVKLNASLNLIAQATAEDLAARNIFQHSGKKFNGQWMGENLFASSGDKPLYQKGSVPVAAWYGEIQYYNWANPGFTMSTGHFTQVIWKGSTELGIGRALSQDGSKMYVVGNYFPGGNVGGAFSDNVKPLC